MGAEWSQASARSGVVVFRCTGGLRGPDGAGTAQGYR